MRLEFSSITQSLHFYTTFNENKLEVVTVGINFNATLTFTTILQIKIEVADPFSKL